MEHEIFELCAQTGGTTMAKIAKKFGLKLKEANRIVENMSHKNENLTIVGTHGFRQSYHADVWVASPVHI